MSVLQEYVHQTWFLRTNVDVDILNSFLKLHLRIASSYHNRYELSEDFRGNH